MMYLLPKRFSLFGLDFFLPPGMLHGRQIVSSLPKTKNLKVAAIYLSPSNTICSDAEVGWTTNAA